MGQENKLCGNNPFSRILIYIPENRGRLYTLNTEVEVPSSPKGKYSPPKKRSDAKDNLITVVPRAGKEQNAFEYLLSDNTADRSPEVMRQS